MKRPRLPKGGKIRIQCPVCEWGDEVKTVDISWWDGEDWSWEHPSSPGEWEWDGGCEHLKHWDSYTREEQTKIKGKVWDEIGEWKREYIAAWADREYDEWKDRKMEARWRLDE